MKKTLLALAVLSAISGVASAQSSVTLSGSLDAGVKRIKGDYSLGGSQSGYNNFTIGGKEDLGGGMNAFFGLNHRFNINNGSINSTTNPQTTFWRNAWVGLGGGFGDVRLGRILMPLQDMNGGFDPFDTGTVGSTHTGGLNATIRSNNAIYYRSPSLGGLSVHAAIGAAEGQSTGEVGSGTGRYFTPAGVINNKRPAGFNIRYAAGPINVGAAYDTNGAKQKTTGLYASYNLGFMTLMGQFEKGDNALSTAATSLIDGEDLKAYSIGAKVPLGNFLIRAGYASIKGGSTLGDGTKFGLGGDYILSKRTYLYSNVGKLSGDRFNAAKEKDAMFDIGVSHRF